MNNDNTNQLMDYLTSRRMSSLGNLANHFACDVEELLPIVGKLQSEQRLRLSNSRCHSGCDSCAGCDSETTMPVATEKTIVISLERKDQDL